MPARPINGRRQFGKLAVCNGHVGFIGAIKCTGINDKHMIIQVNKKLRGKRARSCLARESFACLGRVRSGRGHLARRIPYPGGAVPTRFHIEPYLLGKGCMMNWNANSLFCLNQVSPETPATSAGCFPFATIRLTHRALGMNSACSLDSSCVRNFISVTSGLNSVKNMVFLLLVLGLLLRPFPLHCV